MRSRDLNKWPNGIRLAYRQQFQCGHFVSIWSNHPKPVTIPKGTAFDPDYSLPGILDPELRARVLEMGCIKCVEPVEPLDYQHRGRGGFLKNYVEHVGPSDLELAEEHGFDREELY